MATKPIQDLVSTINLHSGHSAPQSDSKESSMRYANKRTLEIAMMVSKVIFPIFQMWTRDFTARAGVYPDLLAKEFATEIYKAGLTDEQIAQGAENFKRSATDKPWMPNPGEFVELCKEVFIAGTPDAREAYQEACRNAGFLSDAEWSHPVVYVAGKAAGWFNLRTKAEKETWPIFKQAYKDALARVSAGEDLSLFVPKAAIEQRDVFKADLDTAGRVKAMQLLRKMKK